jgi:hypothetical protein
MATVAASTTQPTPPTKPKKGCLHEKQYPLVTRLTTTVSISRQWKLSELQDAAIPHT